MNNNTKILILLILLLQNSVFCTEAQKKPNLKNFNELLNTEAIEALIARNANDDETNENNLIEKIKDLNSAEKNAILEILHLSIEQLALAELAMKVNSNQVKGFFDKKTEEIEEQKNKLSEKSKKLVESLIKIATQSDQITETFVKIYQILNHIN